MRIMKPNGGASEYLHTEESKCFLTQNDRSNPPRPHPLNYHLGAQLKDAHVIVLRVNPR